MTDSKRILHQALACSPVVLSQFVIGLGWGWAASALVKLQNGETAFTVTPNEASWIASINEVGRIVSPFITPVLVDNIGRKNALILVTIMLFFVWSSIFFLYDFYLLCAIRVAFGLANGIFDVTSAIYTTENCSADFRGIVGSVIQVVYYTGVLVEFLLATCLSYSQVTMANILISVVSLCSMYFFVETPYFSIMKGDYDDAEKNLTWLQGGIATNKITIEMKRMKSSIEEEKAKKKSFISLLASPINLRCILIVFFMYMMSIATGCTAVITYASLIFVPSNELNSKEFTILFGVMQLLAVFLSLFIIEKINRRTFLILSLTGMTTCTILSYVLLKFHNNYEIPHYPWLIFLCISLYGSLYSIMSPAQFTVRGELLPLSVRAVGGSAAIIIQSVMSFLTAKMFFPVTEKYGMETNFLGYSVIGVIAIIFIYCALPETRGKTLDEIQKSLREKRGSRSNSIVGKGGMKLTDKYVSV